MRILVATAGKHGSTHDIGNRLADGISTGLAGRNIAADIVVRDAEEVVDLADFDAVVLGSAVYYGRWLKPAVKLADQLPVSPDRLVWLFSSGPIQPTGTDTADAPSKWDDVDWAEDHHTFGGKLDRASLSLPERIVAAVVHADDGDHRDPAEISEWAEEIAERLATLPV